MTVNQKRYQAVLNKFWRCANSKHGKDMEHMWFQQDGAPPHTAGKTMEWMAEHFKHRVISRGAKNVWPASSPDLTPMDFFLWGHLKGQVYKAAPKNLNEVKRAITRAVRAIPAETCRRAVESSVARAQLCLSRKGGYIEHVL